MMKLAYTRRGNAQHLTTWDGKSPLKGKTLCGARVQYTVINPAKGLEACDCRTCLRVWKYGRSGS